MQLVGTTRRGTARAERPPGRRDAAVATLWGPVVSALRNGSAGDAIRSLRQVLAAPEMANQRPLLPAIRAAVGDAGAARVVRALAEARCMYCRGGLDACEECDRTGRADHGAAACSTCSGLGAVRCQFCGGSGLESYEAVPAGLLTAVASCRVDAAAARAARSAAHRPPDQVTAAGLPRVRQALARHAVEQTRDLAVLVNAAQLARSHRGRDVAPRNLVGQLFARSARAAQSSRRQLAGVYRRLASASAHLAALARDPAVREFEQDRSALFAEEAERLLRASRRRTTLLPGR